jgi:hypothetical protein
MNLTKVTVGIENVLLDPNNPRFADVSDDALNINKSRYAEQLIQDAAYEKMSNPKFDILTLSNSIASVGFVQVDNIVCAKIGEGQYYVIEGNRRITAIKYLLKQHAIGQNTMTEEQVEKLRTIDILVVDETENANELVGMIIQGIRNVSGIKDWGPFQKAQFIHEMREKGKQPGEISRTIGMPMKEINRYYKTYSVMLQFKTDAEYAGKWNPSYFSHFDELLKKPALREYFGFNDDTFRFDNISNIKRFYEWIVPDEDNNVTFSDVHNIRKLSEFIDDKTALSYLDDKNIEKAINYINQKNFNQNKMSASECVNKINGAVSAFKSIVAEGLEKEMSDDEFLELNTGISEMLKQLKRVETLRNGN